MPYPPDIDKFYSKIIKTETCWIWTGKITQNIGYIYEGRKRTPVHRFSYKLLVGDIPQSTDIRRSCKNVRCVNPEHLYASNVERHSPFFDLPKIANEGVAKNFQVKILLHNQEGEQ